MSYVGSHLWKVRQMWGQGLLLYPGVAVLFVNDKNEILLGHRSDFNQWCHFGGGAEPLESVEDTLKREVKEELGVVPTAYRVIGSYTAPDIARTVFPHGDDLHYWDFVFLVTAWEGDLVVGDEEHNAVRFFPLDALPDNVFKDVPVILEMLAEWRATGEFQLR